MKVAAFLVCIKYASVKVERFYFSSNLILLPGFVLWNYFKKKFQKIEREKRGMESFSYLQVQIVRTPLQVFYEFVLNSYSIKLLQTTLSEHEIGQ